MFAANSASPALQAEYLRRAIAYRRRYLPTVVERIFRYSLRDSAADPRAWEHNSGLVRHDFRPKPAYRELLRLRRTLRRLTPGLPGWALSSGGTGRAAGSGVTAQVSGTRARTRIDGRSILDSRVRASGGLAAVSVEGFDGRRWHAVARTSVARDAAFRVTFVDRGYVRLRVRARIPGARRAAVQTLVARARR